MRLKSPNQVLQATAGFAFGYNADALGPHAPEHYRSVKATVKGCNLMLLLLLVGCEHYQGTQFRVLDSTSKQPVPSAKLAAKASSGPLRFSDLFRPEWTYPQNQDAVSDSRGLASLRVPMCRSSPMHWHDENGKYVDGNNVVGTAVEVRKDGYALSEIWHSNNEWRQIGRASSPASPVTIELTRNITEPSAGANAE